MPKLTMSIVSPTVHRCVMRHRNNMRVTNSHLEEKKEEEEDVEKVEEEEQKVHEDCKTGQMSVEEERERWK